jgi:hypothetical protein
MAARARFARTNGISLRTATDTHLIDLSECREYLLSRYEAGGVHKKSELNRLDATLNEVSDKVSKAIKKAPTK